MLLQRTGVLFPETKSGDLQLPIRPSQGNCTLTPFFFAYVDTVPIYANLHTNTYAILKTKNNNFLSFSFDPVINLQSREIVNDLFYLLDYKSNT